MENVVSNMDTMTPALLIQKLFQPLGITINGPAPWDIQIHNDHFYTRVLMKAR